MCGTRAIYWSFNMASNAPLTTYLIDLMQFQDGNITADQIRANWKAGNYRGVSTEHARGYAKMFGLK